MNMADVIGRHLVQDNLFTSDDNMFISKSPFSAFGSNETDELVFKGRTTYMNPEHIALQVQMGYLRVRDEDTLDLKILIALDELEFATSRMITIYLNLKGIDIHQKKVQNRLIYMTRLKVLSSYEFVSKDENGVQRRCHASIYFLDAASVFIMKSQDINISYKFDKLAVSLKSKDGIKKTLARNQLMLKYIQEITNISFVKKKPEYSLPNNKKYIPSLQIVIDYENTNHHLFFEVVRSFKGWEENIRNKLENAKLFIETFKANALMPQLPIIVLVGEDDKHSFEIMKFMMTSKLIPNSYNYIFTTDNRVMTNKVNNSLFRFAVEENKANIRTLNIEMFK